MSSKVVKQYKCDSCDYTCSRSSDWSKHLLTRKHSNRTNRTDLSQKSLACKKCSKEYSARNSLWYHESKCNYQEPDNNSIIHKLLADNQELRNFIIEQSKTSSNNMNKIIEQNTDVVAKAIECFKITTNNTTINGNVNNTQKFNINIFLNEQCKDAINFTDFMKNIEISHQDLENNAQLGFVSGISKIFLDNLKQLGINERPIHCTDATRKTLYVKEANNWEKDTELLRMLLGIKTLARKQRTMISEWKDVNDGWEKDDNIQTKLTTLICHSMTDIENDEKETSKIIRAISKNVYLDNEAKQQYIN